jgi:4'-phosphopantetheinyl transferase
MGRLNQYRCCTSENRMAGGALNTTICVRSEPFDSAQTTIEDDDNAVHIWRSPSRISRELLAFCADSLSDDERHRAESRVEPHRSRFIAARGALRYILAAYTRRDPRELRFTATDHGKPVLIETRSGIYFNVSHRGDWALYAVARRRDVGIDIEAVQDFPDLSAVVEQQFAPTEAATVTAMKGSARLHAFYTYWTRYEAFVKALGCGLSVPMKSLCLFQSDTGPVMGISQNRCWSIHTFMPVEGYIGSVAVEGTGAELALRTWQWEAKVAC